MGLATSQLSLLDLRPKLRIDAEVPLSDLAGDTFSLLQQLEPFGQTNPPPTFLSCQAEVLEHRHFGNQSKYLELKLKQGNAIWRAVSFDPQKAEAKIPSYVDIVYEIKSSFWNGEEVLKLNLLDFTPSP